MDYSVEPMDDLNQQRPGHLRPVNRGPAPGGKKKWIIIAGVFAVVAAAGIAAFFLLKKDGSSASQEQTGTQEEQAQDQTPSMSPEEAATPQTYKSDAVNVEFTYRKDWTVQESTDQKRITITSPKFSFTTKDGNSVNDVFTLKIGIGATKEAQATIDASKAIKDSEVIAYDAPTETQRYYTNVSYAGPDETAFSFFIVTGSIALQPSTTLNGSIIINSGDYLIVGGYGADAQNSLSFDELDPTDVTQYAAFEQALAIVKSLKVY